MKHCSAWLLFVFAVGSAMAADHLPLSGSWRFDLDRTDVGIREQWFERALPGKVKLPGSLPAQGIGDEVTLETQWTGGIVDRSWFTAPQYAPYRQPGNIKIPFWLQPEKYYAGVAWYQRNIEIPSDWQGKRVVLSLERPHWETRVWLDEKLIGTHDSLSTPHEYDLGQVAPGRHTLSIRVDNRRIVDIGENSHAISDHTQGNWNGIVGRIELRATPPVWLEDVQVYPDVAQKLARVRIAAGNVTGKPVKVELSLFPAAYLNFTSAPPPIRAEPIQVEIPPGGSQVEAQFSFGDAFYLWDEFNPHLYGLNVRLAKTDERNVVDHRILTFGVRALSTQGTQFVINGRKTFIRGTLECCIFPDTGHPPTDVDSWRKVIRVAKSYGLNLLRFHSYCPPEAAFEAGDELGMYFQVETCWANQSTTLGDGKPVDAWVYAETERILKAYGNHPSFMLMPYGNEPGGQRAKLGKNGDSDWRSGADAYLARYVTHFKALDPRRLWTSGSGWPQLPENQFHVTPDPRIQAWGAGLKSRINAKPPETVTDYRDYIAKRNVPVISHEIGQWCVYPDFDEIPRYRGYLKPKNFEVFRDSLQAHHLGKQAHDFLIASGKLQTLCYKEDIESALRTPGMGGFELLDLHDFPGQGTALVGVLNPFWEDKGYVTAKEYSRFCNSTVPLARLAKRVFTTAEALEPRFEVAHFGPAPLENAVASWKLVAAGNKVVARGSLPPTTIPVDNGIELGSARIDLASVVAPAAYKLVLGIDGTHFENDWDIWVYPAQVNTNIPAGVTLTEELDEAALAKLNSGGKVLLCLPRSRVKNAVTDPVVMGFSSIFWNTAWTHRQAPTTLGILCNPKSPALQEFPTESHSNWQWWYLVTKAAPMILDDLPAELHPIVQVVDDWVTNRRLALLFEAKVARGALLVCSVDLVHDLSADPVRQQFRRSLLDYMASPRFEPKATLTPQQISSIISEPAKSTSSEALNR